MMSQEVIGAACTLATAYSVALWYFAPGTCGRAKAKHLPWAPALQGAGRLGDRYPLVKRTKAMEHG